jgi:Dolichyl-phosphate-mannose-protein mannosyltransferase
MIPIVLFATAFVVRAAVGALFSGPAYPDSYYYAHVGEQLASGLGFTANYIWNFVDVGGRLPLDPTLPIASNAHWMPLAAVIQAPFLLVFGSGWLGGGLAFWIVGALAAPLTYWIGRDAGFDSSPALAAGVMVAVPGGLTPFLSQPDNFGLFMTLGALSLWLCARGLRGDRWSFVAGGLVVGLATLARSDGVILGLPYALVGIRELWRALRRHEVVLPWVAVVGCAALFFVAVAPWMYRQLETFGSFFPSASSGRILWISDFSQLYSISSPIGPDTLFANGVGGFVASRVGGLLSALGLFAFMPLVVVLTPIALIGAWVRRRDAAFGPFFIYAVALFAASGLLFAVHVPFGTFIHSAVALLPHTFLLVTVGVAALVGWIARRRSTWDVARATAIFSYGAAAVVIAGAALQTTNTVRHWSETRAVQQQLAASLSAAPATDRIMSADAGAYNYLTGRQGVVTPNDPLPVIEDAMRAYDIRWLVLEQSAIVPALEPVLTGELRPEWLSQPVAFVPSSGGPAFASTNGAASLGSTAPQGALYAVCLEPADQRCAP